MAFHFAPTHNISDFHLGFNNGDARTPRIAPPDHPRVAPMPRIRLPGVNTANPPRQYFNLPGLIGYKRR